MLKVTKIKSIFTLKFRGAGYPKKHLQGHILVHLALVLSQISRAFLTSAKSKVSLGEHYNF